MYRYISINLNSNPNSMNLNKKPQKAAPISLLSGGKSFFLKVKSNQIATNYNDKNNKPKPNNYQNINKNNFYQKESKDISLNKYLNNSQPKVSFLFAINNSLDYRKPKNIYKSLINKTKPEINKHTKGLYSFTSIQNKDKQNNKSIQSSSMRRNYNEVLLTETEHFKISQNKILNIREKSNETKKNQREKYEKTNYNTNVNDYRSNQTKNLNPKSKINSKMTLDKLNKRIKNKPEKNSITNNKTKNIFQIKSIKKNQYNTNNINKNASKYKNISNILFNTKSNIEKNKNENKEKENNSEGKNRVVFNANKRNSKLFNNKQLFNQDSNNNTYIFKDSINEMDEFDGSLSKRKLAKKVKTINIKPNGEGLRNKENNNFEKIKNDKQLLLQRRNQEKNININHHVIAKSNNILNKAPKLDNTFTKNRLNFNNALADLTGFNISNNKMQVNLNSINNNIKNINSIKNVIEINSQKDSRHRNKNILSDLPSFNNDNYNNQIINNNQPNIVINNNYLYNYMPIVNLNNSTDDEKINRFKLKRNSFLENNYNLNISQNMQLDKLFNYSTIIDNQLNKEYKNQIIKKYKNELDQIRVNTTDANSHNNIINNVYNMHTKLKSSNILDNNINRNKTNRNNLNLYYHREKNNSITKNYISKEKNKKRKQNPPLNKNPKKLNILSIIQENNLKMKNTIKRKPNFSNNLDTDKSFMNKNISATIDYVLYPGKDDLNNNMEMFDNFDDMNTIVKKINFENVDLKKANIFSVEKKNSAKNTEINIWYEKFSENFNNMFDKKFSNNKQNMSATQNKIKKTNYIYHSRQSGSTKASNKENSSIKKTKVSSYIDKKLKEVI